MATKYASSLAAGGGAGTFASPYTLSELRTNYAAGDDCRLIADGVYSMAAAFTSFATAGTASAPVLWSGCRASDGAIDGTRATVKATASMTTMWVINTLYHDLQYIDFDGNSLAGNAVANGGGYTRHYAQKFTNFTGFCLTNFFNSPVLACEFGNSGGGVGGSNSSGYYLAGCDFHDIAGIVIQMGNQVGSVVENCNVWKSTPGVGGVAAVYIGGPGFRIKNVRINDTNQNGVYVASGWGDIIDTIVARSTTWGFNAAAASGMVRLINCAGYSNTSGNVHSNLSRSTNFKPLTVDPFQSQSTGNLALKSTFDAGGSGDLKAAGFPGTYPAGLTVGYNDIGVQHQDTGGGGGSTFFSRGILTGGRL